MWLKLARKSSAPKIVSPRPGMANQACVAMSQVRQLEETTKDTDWAHHMLELTKKGFSCKDSQKWLLIACPKI